MKAVYFVEVSIRNIACVPVGSHPLMQTGVPVGSRCRHEKFLGAMSAPDTACRAQRGGAYDDIDERAYDVCIDFLQIFAASSRYGSP